MNAPVALFLALLFFSAGSLCLLCMAKFIQNCFLETERPRTEALRWVVRRSWIGFGLSPVVPIGVWAGMVEVGHGAWLGTLTGWMTPPITLSLVALPRIIRFARSEMGREYRVMLGTPLGTTVVGGFLVDFFRDFVDPTSLVNTILVLVTVNGVVIGLSYNTMKEVHALAKSGVPGAAFVDGAWGMTLSALLGIIGGTGYVLFQPYLDYTGVLMVVMSCLLGGIILFPFVAIQQQVAVKWQKQNPSESSRVDAIRSQENADGDPPDGAPC